MVLSCIDNFNIDDLKRIISLSQELTKSWPSDILAFPDYNESCHSKEATIAKSAFENANCVLSFYPGSKSLQS